ncbi:hypothetical protein SAMN05192551_104221 [Tindallia magadiensis]|uniref:Uncharacterized protein n=1 Tax=Tindallia magadiensis TaxID=69895 RepID=A0A1I3E320_9FIRM|nr:hypothetical protein [Tindallia magadiensis]SFH93422.1 hypothetical protein SAMN05192551_104221 [Tindallia magadiensis]
MTPVDISIVHELPGRLRLRLFRPPTDAPAFTEAVRQHEGIESVVFQPRTRSLLIYYQPTEVSDVEIVVRVGVRLSLDYQQSFVRISRPDSSHPPGVMAYSAAGAILIATLTNALRTSPFHKFLVQGAGGLTALAVVDHAWQEWQENQEYHPEVFSLVYLLGSLMSGHPLRASIITWLVTFGRHLVESPGNACLLRADPGSQGKDKNYLDVMIRRDPTKPANPLSVLISALSASIGMQTRSQENDLLESISHMASRHHHLLESLESQSGRIYLRLDH